MYNNIVSLQVVTPSNNVLVKDLTLKVEPGSNLLITGKNFNVVICDASRILVLFSLMDSQLQL